MSLEEYFSGRGAERLLRSLSECLHSVGTEGFNTSFLKLTEHVVKADQCMVFSYRADRPECYLSFNRRQSKNAANLAAKYLRSAYREDPVVKYLDKVQTVNEMRILRLSDLRAEMPEHYYQTFFRASGIVDKIVVIVGTKEEALALNFYRFTESGAFTVSDESLQIPFWQIVSKIALLHYTGKKAAQLRSPLNSLSKREKTFANPC
ncbi:hypothetical protein P6U16_24685 (plasmid) [Rhizobium sp. 32-5/1]|uniref:hypothetical protein n=1 Tax=Rhizobium sp. 32-5/1 TaxID=3019602 RepID=UPI00240DD15E|nr:hypothetical protein [Rhizobium sp. 32-5/1]WEZ85338.1 hypothetical protein P6U16_24685 [Rhizobium sp. 32-5/1]